MSRFGPTRRELWVRFTTGAAGSIGLLAVWLWPGLDLGAGFIELVVIGGAFFGGTAIWSGARLWRRDHP